MIVLMQVQTDYDLIEENMSSYWTISMKKV